MQRSGILEFNIRVEGLDRLVKSLTDVQQNQIPFATAKALTDTAKDVQTEVLRTLPFKFKLRTSWFQPGNKYGFRVKSATKQNLQAVIYTDALWMNLQEQGAIKIAHNGRKMIAVQTANVQRTGSGRIKEDQKPAYLLRGYSVKGRSKAKGMGRRAEFTGVQAFIGVVHGSPAIWLRVGRHLKLMYVLLPDAKISPRLHFVETGKRIVALRWHINFESALYEAMRTAR